MYETGDVDKGIWSAGVTIGLVNDIPTCKALMKRMVKEAEEVIEGMTRLRRGGRVEVVELVQARL